MTLLRADDQALHHSDGSHRGLCRDPNMSQEAWAERLRMHMADHRANPDAGYLVARSGATIGTPLRRRGVPP